MVMLGFLGLNTPKNIIMNLGLQAHATMTEQITQINLAQFTGQVATWAHATRKEANRKGRCKRQVVTC